MASSIRALRLLSAGHCHGPSLSRTYASNTLGTSSTTSSKTRKRVTVINDDGKVPWGQLSATEKVARTSQQTVNGSVIFIGSIATAGVAYLLWDQVFSTDSKVAHFNRAFDELKEHEKCVELLGPANKLRAHGENTWNKWTRNRAISSMVKQDGGGKDHLMMQFYVEGPKAKGTVRIHMVRPEVNAAFVYKTFTLDVPGHHTIYLRNENIPNEKKSGFKFLGVQWG